MNAIEWKDGHGQLKHDPVMCISAKGNWAVTYSKFGMGDKYKLLRRVYIPNIDDIYWKHVECFQSVTKAQAYTKYCEDILQYLS